MKITKQQLKHIIKEEFEKVASTSVRQSARQDAAAQVAGGVTDSERGIIQTLLKQLTAAAQSGNITSGNVFRLADLLSKELAKTVPQQPEPPQK